MDSSYTLNVQLNAIKDVRDCISLGRFSMHTHFDTKKILFIFRGGRVANRNFGNTTRHNIVTQWIDLLKRASKPLHDTIGIGIGIWLHAASKKMFSFPREYSQTIYHWSINLYNFVYKYLLDFFKMLLICLKIVFYLL